MKKMLIVLLLTAVVVAWKLSEELKQSEFNPPLAPEIIADDLAVPWGIAFLPSGEILVTERVSFPDNFFAAGRLIKISGDQSKTEIEIPPHKDGNEIGLRGVLLHPEFSQNNWLYLYQTILEEKNVARVVRYKLVDDRLTEPFTIIENIPGGPFQDGGRMIFGKDGKLYITSGDGADGTQSQNLSTLAGKILRLNEDGSVPADNPFNSPIYTYGHRNPQGITWDDEGNLWSSEHGDKKGLDEVNLITVGSNYGWPHSQGGFVATSTTGPSLHSGEKAWAPGSLTYVDGHLVWGGLASETLFIAELQGAEVGTLHKLFTKEFGRIRTVALGPDDYLYFTSSNRDWRGDLRPQDDKLFKLHKTSLFKLLNDDQTFVEGM